VELPAEVTEEATAVLDMQEYHTEIHKYLSEFQVRKSRTSFVSAN